MKREQERLIDTIVYLVSLSQSAFRFAKGQEPFDFESLPTAEFIMARCLPFIENEECDYRKAHLDFIQYLVEKGWSHGPENFKARTHQDITSWDSLGKSSKEMYGYIAGIVCSAKGFYLSLKEDFENDFINCFSPELQGRAKNALNRINVSH